MVTSIPKENALHQSKVAEVQEAGSRAVVSSLEHEQRDKVRISAASHLKVETLPNGLAISHQSAVQTNIIYAEIFESEVYMQHGIILRDGACVFDVGAHIGLFSLYAHRHCNNAHIYAFEPGPGSFAALHENVTRHTIDARIFNIGLSNESKQAQYLFFPHMSGMSGLFADVDREKKAFRVGMHHWLEESGNKDRGVLRQELDDRVDAFFTDSQLYTCDFKTLSRVIEEQNVTCIDLLKIDAEGSELAILQGVHDNDWPKIKQVVAEIHNRDLLMQVSGLLAKHGYDVTVEVEEGAALTEFEENDGYRLSMLYAIRHGRSGVGAQGEVKYVVMHRHSITSETLSHMLGIDLSQSTEQ